MVVYHKFSEFSELDKFLSDFPSSKKLILLFCGSPAANGVSWCSDCVKAEPVVEKVVKENEDKDFHFAKATVGSRDEWKNPRTPYRTDPRLKLTSVPTLMLWGSAERLGDDECQSPDLVKLLFESLG